MTDSLGPSRLVALLLGALTISACQTDVFDSPSLEGIEAPAAESTGRDPRLDQLGLVYDDTLVTTSARTVDFNGQAVIPRYVRVQKGSAGKDLTVDLTITKVVLGVNPNFTVSLAVPYASKRLKQAGGATLRSEGIADSALVGKYRFYQDTGLGETTEAALLFGLELPTGKSDVRSGGMTLPQPLQPGSASLDAILGGAFTRVDGRWLLNADLIAKLNSEGNDYRFGNSIRADVGGHYRAYPARYERFDQTTVNLVAELNGNWAAHNQSSGARVDASGGTKVFATPGVQVIVNASLLFEAAVQLPILMDLNGEQLEEDFVAIAGLRFRF